MALTVQECSAHIEHTLAGEISPEIGVVSTINRAGDFFATAYPWRWLEGRSSAVGTTAGQDYTTLPSDLRELVGWQATAGLVQRLEITSLQSLIDRRTNEVFTTSWHYWGAITHRVGASGGVEPILELWPTPGSTAADVFTIFYRAGWTDVANDTDVLAIPDYTEAPYLQILRAFARGYEEEDVASLDTRLGEVVAGPLFLSAVTRDSLIQPSYGPVENTAIQASRVAQNNYLRSTVSGPS